jgi:tetratricopeptide (TPR) repeat protein
VFSWSYRHLPAEAARAFRLIGLHPGPDCDAYAVAALTGVTATRARDVLAVLARAHLVHPAGAGRYGLHDLLRAYAGQLAADHGEAAADSGLTRLFDYYLSTAASAMDVLVPAEKQHRPRVGPASSPAPVLAGPAQARAWLDAERPVLVAVAARGAGQGWPGHAVRLAATLYRYLETGGHYADAVTVHGHARSAACLAGDRAGEATALTNLGIISWRQGRYQQAIDYHERALAASAEIGNRLGEAIAVANLGVVHERQGRYEQSAACHERALVLFRAAGDRSGEARALGNLGSVAGRQGRYEQAISWYERSLALFRAVGDQTGEASALPDLGLAYQRQGRPEQAVGCYRHALALFRESGDRTGEAEALNGVGEILLSTGRPDEARAEHTAALTLASQTGDAYEQARAHRGLSAALAATGDVDQARQHRCRARDLYAELGAPEADDPRVRLAGLTVLAAQQPGLEGLELLAGEQATREHRCQLGQLLHGRRGRAGGAAGRAAARRGRPRGPDGAQRPGQPHAELLGSQLGLEQEQLAIAGLDPDDRGDRGPGGQRVQHGPDGHSLECLDRAGSAADQRVHRVGPAAEVTAALFHDAGTADFQFRDVLVGELGEDIGQAVRAHDQPVGQEPQVVPSSRDHAVLGRVPAQERDVRKRRQRTGVQRRQGRLGRSGRGIPVVGGAGPDDRRGRGGVRRAEADQGQPGPVPAFLGEREALLGFQPADPRPDDDGEDRAALLLRKPLPADSGEKAVHERDGHLAVLVVRAEGRHRGRLTVQVPGSSAIGITKAAHRMYLPRSSRRLSSRSRLAAGDFLGRHSIETTAGASPPGAAASRAA